jgi:hypothetical protein
VRCAQVLGNRLDVGRQLESPMVEKARASGLAERLVNVGRLIRLRGAAQQFIQLERCCHAQITPYPQVKGVLLIYVARMLDS